MASFFPHPWFPAFDGSLQGGGGGGAAPTHFAAGAIAASSSSFSSSMRHVAGHLRDRCAAQLRVLLLLPPSFFSESCNFGVNLNGKVLSLKKLLDSEAVSSVLSAAVCSSWFSFSNVQGDDMGFGRKQNLQFGNSQKKPFDRRLWTNVLLAINVLAYAAQIATQGKLLIWGAKVNNLIDQGQLWRLATSSLLHANIGHLMINCYSLNSIGPTVEQLSGPKRFLAIYCTSAITSSLMSYKFCRSPAVGASGAIFGLVGSFAVFILRHRKLIASGKNDLLHVAHVIALNMAIGFLSRGIDNWGHFGGLLGGAAVSWFLGPTWKYQFQTRDGRLVYADQAPVIQLINWRKRLS